MPASIAAAVQLGIKLLQPLAALLTILHVAWQWGRQQLREEQQETIRDDPQTAFTDRFGAAERVSGAFDGDDPAPAAEPVPAEPAGDDGREAV